MDKEILCSRCGRQHSCSRIYNELAASGAPSVTTKVVVAFLLPLLVFIITLAVSGRLLTHLIKSGELRMVADLLLALPVTCIYIFVARLVVHISARDR